MSYSYDDIKNLWVGDRFWISNPHTNIRYCVCEAPVETYCDELNRNQLEWCAVASELWDSERFMITEGLEHYGPKLYDQPAYGTIEELTKAV